MCGTSAVTDMPYTDAPNRSSADDLYASAVHETVAALRSIREQWAELLLAIETPPARVRADLAEDPPILELGEALLDRRPDGGERLDGQFLPSIQGPVRAAL